MLNGFSRLPLHHVAIGAYFAAGILLSAPLSAQSPEASGSTQPSPSVQGDSTGQTDNNQSAAERPPFPVRIVEDPKKAEDAERREQRAEQREADDLIAQQRAAAAAERAADAAESQRVAAWWQTALTALGTLGLLYTLALTRRSVKEAGRSADAALAALQAAERTAERQLRAYIGILDISVSHVATGRSPRVAINLKNFGQTPAHRLGAKTEIEVMPTHAPVFAVGPLDDNHRQSIGPGATFNVTAETDKALTEAQASDLNSGSANLYCFGFVEYTDAFGHTRYTRFRHEIGDAGILSRRSMPLSAAGNDAN